MPRPLPDDAYRARAVRSPASLLVALTVAGLICCALVVFGATRTPWMGLALATDDSPDAVWIRQASGPAAGLPIPARLLGLGSAQSGGALDAVTGTDLIEDPSMLASYAEQNDFFARQRLLAAHMAQGAVLLQLRDETGATGVHELQPQASRPLSSLPLVFWVQLASGLAALLIGAWVWVLRPADWGARMFGCTGAMMLAFALPAALYSTRELALPESTFRALSAANMAGALSFGCALIAIFLCFPRQLVRPVWLLVIPAVFAVVLAGDYLQLWPAPLAGPGTLIQTLIAAGCIAVQWRANRRDPQARAALRWLGLAAILGAALFVGPQVAAPLLGGAAPTSQGYGFVFFLIMYAGMALGISRYRLFQLDEWAFRILLWVAGVVLLLLIDAALIWLLHLTPTLSLGLAVLLAGFLYLPLRNLLWQRLVARRTLDQDQVFRAVLRIALEKEPAERARTWQELLAGTFAPLEIQRGESLASDRCAPLDDGLSLHVPAVACAPALVLRYPWQGRGLFGATHVRLAQRLTDLVRYADASHDSFMRGVTQERQRIMRDLHDDVGARLISGLRQDNDETLRQTLRGVLHDLRAILSGVSGEPLALGQLLADLHNEAADRLASAGIALEWSTPAAPGDELALGYDVYKNIMSAHREVISNVLRHAQAQSVSIEVTLTESVLAITTTDCRNASEPAAARSEASGSRGLANIRHRLESIGGRASFMAHAQGSTTTLSTPLPGAPRAAATAAP